MHQADNLSAVMSREYHGDVVKSTTRIVAALHDGLTAVAGSCFN